MEGEFLQKLRKIFLNVQIEETERNILQKEWGKKAFVLS